MHKLLLSVLALSLWMGFATPSQALTCTSPYVEYQNQCVDPIPACINPPQHFMFSSCIDKIENGQYIENYNFTCMNGYVRSGDKCVEKPQVKVTLSSTPSASNGLLHSSGVLETELGKTIDFKRTISGSSNFGWSWSYDSSKLSCGAYPEFDSPTFRCKVVAAGQSNVSISIYDANDKLTAVQSNIITVTTEKKAPAAGYEDEVEVNISSYTNPFSDTSMQTLGGQAASELYRRGIIGGFADGEFKGSQLVNRAEAAKFLLLARYGRVNDMKNSGKFSDVKDGEWYATFVMNAANLGIIQGYADGQFKPQNGVNTAEFLKMFTLSFGLQTDLKYSYSDVDANAWFAPYAGIAEKYNLFPERVGKLSPSSALTRNEVAVAIYQYLKNR